MRCARSSADWPRQCTVAVISGRDLADVRERVGLEEIVYAGSHGFEIVGPGGLRKENREAQACLAGAGRSRVRACGEG